LEAWRLECRQIVGSPWASRSINHTTSKHKASMPQGNCNPPHFADWRPMEEVRCQPRGDDPSPTCGWSPPSSGPTRPTRPTRPSPTGIVVFGMGLEQTGVIYSSTHAMLSSNQHHGLKFQCCQVDVFPKASQRYSTNSLLTKKLLLSIEFSCQRHICMSHRLLISTTDPRVGFA
jgi:hypothetical protein